jgi:hypothetical protein
VNSVPLAHQYVLYGAATHESLLELLTHWQPCCPELEWPDMAIHVPVLATAITELVDRGDVELFYGLREGEIGIVLCGHVPSIVNDPSNWWNDASTPRTALALTETAGPAPIPHPRPHVYRCRRAPSLEEFRTLPLRE